MNVIDCLNNKIVRFADIDYGERFIRNISGEWKLHIKTPWSICKHLLFQNDEKEYCKHEYNAICLEAPYIAALDNLDEEQYEEYLKNTFVFIDYEEKVVTVVK